MEHPALRAAARVGHTFKIDPLIVLRATPFEWLVRQAAALVVQSDLRSARGQSGD